jgi:hypothetical protein
MFSKINLNFQDMKKIKYFFWLLWFSSNMQAQNTLVTKLCLFNEDVRVQIIIEPVLKDSMRITLRISNLTHDTIAIDDQIRPYFSNHDSTLEISGDFFGIRACYESFHRFRKLAPKQIFVWKQETNTCGYEKGDFKDYETLEGEVYKIHTPTSICAYQRVHLEVMYVKNIAACIKQKWFRVFPNPTQTDMDMLWFPLNEKLTYEPLNGIDVWHHAKTQKSDFLINCRTCDQF